jgi:hypothetical protein
MQTYRFPLNLQLFAEDGPEDDDDWDADDTPTDGADDDDFEDTGDDTKTDEPTTADPTEPPTTDPEPVKPETFKLKYNGEEREIPAEEARALAQKGMNYEKAMERARQEARDTYISEQGMEWRGKPITTEAQYKQAIQEKEWEDNIRSKNNLPDEVVQELVEAKRDREERAREKVAAAEQAKEQAIVQEFFEYFQSINERPFSPTDVIPAEVKAAVDRGENLTVAYVKHQNAELMQQLRTYKQNETNAGKAPVTSTTAHGSKPQEPKDLFLAEFDKD